MSSQIPNSTYVEQATSVDTGPVELTQLVRFLKELTAGDEKHDIQSIRLTERAVAKSSETDEVEKWSAEIAISSWTYSKK